jgi:hypothetical protein
MWYWGFTQNKKVKSLKESLLKLKLFFSYFCVEGLRTATVKELSDYDGIIDAVDAKKLIDYKFLVKITPAPGLSYYFRMSHEVIEYALDTEVGPLIEAIYSMDLTNAKTLQFYQVEILSSEKGKRVRTRIYRLAVKPRTINKRQLKDLRNDNHFKEKKAQKILQKYRDVSRDNINN